MDANVLLYAVNRDAADHEVSRRWLDEALSGTETVGFAWIVLLAFLRLSTKASVFPAPLSLDQATQIIEAWLGAPAAVIVHPSREHPKILHRLLEERGVAANLVNDAHLAALAIEHRCGIISYDRDFSRFPGIAWSEPA